MSIVKKLILRSRKLSPDVPRVASFQNQSTMDSKQKQGHFPFPKICVPTFHLHTSKCRFLKTYNLNLSGKHNFQLLSAILKQEDTHLQINTTVSEERKLLRRTDIFTMVNLQIHEHNMHLHLFRPSVSFISTV